MLKDIVEQLKKCSFECEAGPLELNMGFIQLELLADAEEEYEAAVIELDEEDMLHSIHSSLANEGLHVSEEIIEKVLNMQVDYMTQVGIIEPDEVPEG